MNYSLRFKATKIRLQILEEEKIGKRELPRVNDYLFKPKGVGLKDFHPQKVAIRLRDNIDDEKPAILSSIESTKRITGYTDKKKKLGEGEIEKVLLISDKLGFERWGVLKQHVFEYDLGYAKVLFENTSPIGEFFKIESKTHQGLERVIKLLNIRKEEYISKNSAVILGEKKGLI